jgi:hypothetical protein
VGFHVWLPAQGHEHERPGTVFVVHNEQQFRRPQAVRNDALHIAGPVLGVMMSNSTDGLLLRAYTAAIVQGYHFRLASIPDDAEVGHNFLVFDPEQIQATFDIGYEPGRAACSSHLIYTRERQLDRAFSLVGFGSSHLMERKTSSDLLPPKIYPHQPILRDTAVWKEIASEGALFSDLQAVDGQSWIDHGRAFDFTISEHAIRVRDSILLLLCWLDETVLDELQEDQTW